MASPVWKIYLHKEYRASCKHAEDAAALVAFLGDGAQIRWDHAFVAWTEGKESQPAAESYDHVAAVAQARVQEMQAKRYAESQARAARAAAEWKAQKA